MVQSQAKIMVVEDEGIVARDIRNMLIGLGYTVTDVLSTSEKAIQAASEKSPDLVLMDIMLEGERSGVDAADYIYSRLNIPIVYLTAFTDETSLQRAKKTEPFGYLLKPFEERELQTTIEIALYKFKMERKLKNRERWLFTILENVGTGVIATDKKGRANYMNPMAEAMTGVNLKNSSPVFLKDIYPVTRDNSTQPVHIPIHNILRGEKINMEDEAVLNPSAGKSLHVRHNINPILDENNNISGAVLTFSDITQRKKAEEAVKQSWKKQKRAMEGTVQAMAFIVEARDPYTAGHQKRVTRLASAIAGEMTLSQDQIEGIRMAGGLHDIGKIYVPSEILSKPGKISPVEFNIIKTHPQVGYDILKSIEFPWPVGEFVLQHHERMDGSGYPAGLKGEDIHIEARILAVADVIE
ncbi:MAG: HD domain-containing phosphohydrolase, partial [Candidatus Aminicenantaceae bacterium]